MIYQRSFWLCILSSLLMVGCKHGCTFTTVVKKISKKEKVGTANIEIEVALLKKRNIRFTKSDHRFHTSNRGYSIAIYVEADTQSINPGWYFPAESGTNLKPYLKDLSIKASPQNNYFVLSYNGPEKKAELYQRLGNKWIESPFKQELDSGKYTMATLPNENAFIDLLIFEETILHRFANEKFYIEEFIRQKRLTRKQLDGLLMSLESGNTSLAESYFTDENIKKVGLEHPPIKEKMLKMSIAAILDSKGSSQTEDIFKKVLLAYGNQKDFQQCDKVIFQKWRESFSDREESYVKSRFTNTKHPIDPKLLKTLATDAKVAIDKTLRNADNYSKYHYGNKYIYPDKAAQLLFWMKDKAYQQKIVENYLSKNEEKSRNNKLEALIDTEFSSLVPELQSKLLQHAKTKFAQTLAAEDPFDAANWYNFLDGKIACSELKALNKEYIDKGKSAVFLDKQKPDC